MAGTGVILYGPPASGKDTITEALHERDSRFCLFRRLKVGQGKTGTYRMTTAAHLADLRADNLIIWENERYNAQYAVDRPGLAEALTEGIPVLHLGQVPAVHATHAAFPGTFWLTVALTCPRDATTQRLSARNPADVDERLAAWDATEHLPMADLRIDSGSTTASQAAFLISETLTARL